MTLATQAHAAELDHVLVAVSDVVAAARVLEDGYGLTTVEGGRHPSVPGYRCDLNLRYPNP